MLLCRLVLELLLSEFALEETWVLVSAARQGQRAGC